MEHLCKNCVEMLKEHWPYIKEEIQVKIVEEKDCDNTYIGKGVNPYSIKRKNFKKIKTITIKKGERK